MSLNPSDLGKLFERLETLERKVQAIEDKGKPAFMSWPQELPKEKSADYTAGSDKPPARTV